MPDTPNLAAAPDLLTLPFPVDQCYAHGIAEPDDLSTWPRVPSFRILSPSATAAWMPGTENLPRGTTVSSIRLVPRQICAFAMPVEQVANVHATDQIFVDDIRGNAYLNARIRLRRTAGLVNGWLLVPGAAPAPTYLVENAETCPLLVPAFCIPDDEPGRAALIPHAALSAGAAEPFGQGMPFLGCPTCILDASRSKPPTGCVRRPSARRCA